jgi:glutamine synthetase adenylyltransferase
MQTTVNLSENAYQNVSSIAQMTERTIDEVIEETFENRFEEEVEMLKKSIELSNDKEVLAVAAFQMPEKQSNRLSFLLAKNSEETITEKEKEELGSLMQINRLNDLRKAIGIVEALKRGLISSVDDLA